MGGLKRKIDTGKKIDGKNPRAVAFSKRRKGLFNKASELCLLSDTQIAILATPISSNSHASFYSFGHSSVDNVVSAFLAGQTPPRDDDDDEKLGFWWEDESLGNSQNPEELGCAIDSMRKMLHDLKELKNKQRDRVDVTHQQQTLDHQPCSSSLCVEVDDVSVNVQGFQDKNSVDDDVSVNVQGFQNNTDEEQTLPNNDGLLGSFDGCNQEFDLDQLYDFVTKSEDLWKDMEMYDVCVDVEKEKGGSHVTHQQQTLDHQPCSSSLFVDIDDDVSVNVQGFHNNNTEEQQQALAVSGSFDEELDVDDIWKNLELDDLTVNLQGFQNNTDEEQTLANDDGLHGSFDGCNQEFDIDQLYDFVTKSEDLWKDMEMYDDCLY
ncbi:PREDICTED: agamous-like MADS-box protein AGL97 [Camelina sativa]|uniref:Agamous-like MADS-box protein AGL97 n=1 Tax=Camelina sativa TaxID=90675 RepID=A0ABM0Z7X9_CAMSA|nr:PREDICTED: agamous-like MADS-box protein AGL97 [Camelina sativa]